MSLFFRKVLRLTVMCVVLSFGQSLPSYAQSPEAIEVKVGVKGQEKVQKIVPGSGQSFRDADYAPEMVVVPAGKFTMGSPSGAEGRSDDEGPQHEVTIGKAFVVGKFEVTRGQFHQFVSATGYKAGDQCYTYENSEADLRSGRSYLNPGFKQEDNHPVACVSWDDAKAYVTWLSEKTGQSYRLLTEVEWEYAARAGTQTRYSFGDDEKDLGDHAWYDGNSNRQTHPVGDKKPNPFGLYDLHGNVWEWVEDVYHDNYEGAPQDGSAWMSGGDQRLRVLRGGSWYDGPQVLRSAFRDRSIADDRYFIQGFRIARML